MYQKPRRGQGEPQGFWFTRFMAVTGPCSTRVTIASAARSTKSGSSARSDAGSAGDEATYEAVAEVACGTSARQSRTAAACAAQMSARARRVLM